MARAYVIGPARHAGWRRARCVLPAGAADAAGIVRIPASPRRADGARQRSFVYRTVFSHPMLRISTPALGALACGVALIACGSASSADEPRDAGFGRGRRREREPGRGLAAAGYAGRVASDPDQLPRRRGDDGHRRDGEGLEQRLAQRRPARLLDRAPARASYRASRSERARRSPCSAQVTGGPSTGAVTTSFTIAHQYAPEPEAVPAQPGQRRRSPALPLGALADAVVRADLHAR